MVGIGTGAESYLVSAFLWGRTLFAVTAADPAHDIRFAFYGSCLPAFGFAASAVDADLYSVADLLLFLADRRDFV